MAERIPLPILAGDVLPLVGVDFTIATIVADTELVSASVNVLTAPTTAPATFAIRRAGVTLATVSIAIGQRSGSWVGSVAIAAGDVLELRATDAGDTASDASGRISFGADVFLTSVDRVKEFAGIVGTSSDALLLELVAGVTKALESACGRPLILRAYVETLRVRSSMFETLTLRAYPIASSPAPTITLDGAALTAGVDYELDAEAGILRRIGDAWREGDVVVATYSAGFGEIPSDLRLAATKQTRHEFRQTQPGGDRLGDRAVASEVGGTTQYEADGLLPSVIRAIAPYVEVAVRGA